MCDVKIDQVWCPLGGVVVREVGCVARPHHEFSVALHSHEEDRFCDRTLEGAILRADQCVLWIIAPGWLCLLTAFLVVYPVCRKDPASDSETHGKTVQRTRTSLLVLITAFSSSQILEIKRDEVLSCQLSSGLTFVPFLGQLSYL